MSARLDHDAVLEEPVQRATIMKPRPIRVLFIEQAIAFGGAFVVIAELIRRLHRERIQPLLVTAMEPRFVAERLGTVAPAWPLRHAMHYVRVAALRHRLARLGVPRRVAGYLATALATVANLAYSMKLAATVVRQRADVIHVNNGTEHMESNVVLFALASRCVVHAHGIGRPSFLQRIFLNRVSRVVAISDAVRDNLVRGGIDPDRIVVVPNPLSVHDAQDVNARKSVRDQYSLPQEAFLFGIFGRVVRWKGHREFLLAAAEVIRAVPNAYAMIVGDTADLDAGYDAEVHRIAHELGIAHRVVFTGFVSDVAGYYQAMDIVVHCSIEPEPFGLVITEAMASGTAVVAANRGAPLEIITHGVDGLLVDPERTGDLANAIRGLLEDNERREALANRAREMALRRYDPDRYARTMEGIYFEVGSHAIRPNAKRAPEES